VLADDFLCTQRTLVTDIVVFGSWYNDLLPVDPANVLFRLSFHADIPDPDGPGPEYSRPGEVLWVHDFPPGSFFVRPYAAGLQEGWMTPPDQYVFPGDTVCWMYYFHVPASDAFCQRGRPNEPRVYWLDVQAEPGGPTVAQFGWKTASTHWNDDAVWGHGFEPYPGPWFELRYPPMHPYHGQSIDLAFALGGDLPCPPLPCPGDSNCDGLVNWRDIDFFVAAMSGEAAWRAMFLPGVPTCPYSNNDINHDGIVNWRDIDPFVALMNTICP